MKKLIKACPLCRGKLKMGRAIPPRGIIFAGAMGRKYQCTICKKEVLPVEFDTEEDYEKFLNEIKSE